MNNFDWMLVVEDEGKTMEYSVNDFVPEDLEKDNDRCEVPLTEIYKD